MDFEIQSRFFFLWLRSIGIANFYSRVSFRVFIYISFYKILRLLMVTFNMITALVTLTYDTGLIYLDFCTIATATKAIDTAHIVKVITDSIS